jgi:hypothetical protein
MPITLGKIGSDNLGIGQCPYCLVSIWLPVTGAAKCDACGKKVITKDGIVKEEYTQVRFAGDRVPSKESVLFYLQVGRGTRTTTPENVMISEGGFTFYEVMQMLTNDWNKHNYKFKRINWKSDKYIENSLDYIQMVVKYKNGVTEIHHYLLCEEDILAKDWIVYNQ